MSCVCVCDPNHMTPFIPFSQVIPFRAPFIPFRYGTAGTLSPRGNQLNDSRPQ